MQNIRPKYVLLSALGGAYFGTIILIIIIIIIGNKNRNKNNSNNKNNTNNNIVIIITIRYQCKNNIILIFS